MVLDEEPVVVELPVAVDLPVEVDDSAKTPPLAVAVPVEAFAFAVVPALLDAVVELDEVPLQDPVVTMLLKSPVISPYEYDSAQP